MKVKMKVMGLNSGYLLKSFLIDIKSELAFEFAIPFLYLFIIGRFLNI